MLFQHLNHRMQALLAATGLLFLALLSAQANVPPVNPDATPEAAELLDLLYDLSGQSTLSGQHDYPMSGSYFYRYAKSYSGHYPAIMGRDLGFSPPDTLDGINFRQQTIDDLIAAHGKGTLITLMWHAAPPTQQEPVEFRSGVQSDLSDAEWEAMLTPGTAIHERWKSQVDAIAPYLLQLQLAGVPVLWRPYHEMNGRWFWWGARPGERGYAALYRMLYERLVDFHGFHHLIWVFNGNQVFGDHIEPYADFYPGHDVVDVLATDVYRSFETSDYEALLELGEGRPIALGEMGPFPTPEYLEQHPKWVWFMSWTDFLLKTEGSIVSELYGQERVLNLDSLQTLRKARQ